MIFGCLWIKKDKVLFNIINNLIIFLPKYYIYFGVPSFSIFTIIMINTKIIFMAIQKNVLLNQILEKCLMKKIDKFLKIPEVTNIKEKIIVD